MSLYTYPSNKLEYLTQVLANLLKYEEKENILSQSQIIVGSRGMQHWLSMQLANNSENKISMNLKYDMINAFIIDIIYKLADKLDHKKAYTSQNLVWRVFNLIDEIESEKIKEYCNKSLLKKYQLSLKIADTFSMYLTYRLDWLEKWEKNQFIENKPQNDEKWQKDLWQKLVEENSNTPHSVLRESIEQLSKEKKLNLPKDIFIFAVNTISPKNLDFLEQLSKYIDLNVFYINPSCEFWYDFKKEKISNWLEQDDYELQPLLANLGQQGKEFFNKLLKMNEQKHEFETFAKLQQLENSQQTQLISLQRNLLELNCNKYFKEKDNSITINSCYSPLREVQILHDNLLDMIKKNPDIKPRDILVMCPNIEDYSPYIDSVFSKLTNDKDKLPCSIADRTILDSEPLAQSFIDLLQLPETNFEVNKILDYLSVPALQNKFNITDEQIEKITYWLKETAIHHSNNSNEMFSWNWGLKRLMLGFSFSDNNEILNDNFLTSAVIEGSEIQQLGGLYELLEKLQYYTNELREYRTLKDWQNFILEMLDDLFKITNEEQRIYDKIKDKIINLVDLATSIIKDNNEKIDLSLIKYCLTKELSEPIINNHFLNGKVTFCSMTPMRSIPFKVVAVLGLNSGKFPRQETAISFDLMARNGRKEGDRIRREDDRYLFLETLISAREYLYISYVGKNIKTGAIQEPSLILKELINYLKDNYGWTDNYIKEYPLHPFNKKCYSNEYQSYDQNWLKILIGQQQNFNDIEKSNKKNTSIRKDLTINEITSAFDNPLKYYTRNNLKINLEDYTKQLDNNEPTDIDNLEKYSLKQDIFNNLNESQNIAKIKKTSELSGKFPDSFITSETVDKEVETIKNINNEIIDLKEFKKESFSIRINEYILSTSAYIKDDKLKLVTISGEKIKYKFELYINSLILAIKNKSDIKEATYYFLYKEKVKKYSIKNINYDTAKEKLVKCIEDIKTIALKPTLSHLKLLANKENEQEWNKAIIGDKHSFDHLNKCDYFKLFYNDNIPEIDKFDNLEIYNDFVKFL